jgi:hypothetical protein
MTSWKHLTILLFWVTGLWAAAAVMLWAVMVQLSEIHTALLR